MAALLLTVILMSLIKHNGGCNGNLKSQNIKLKGTSEKVQTQLILFQSTSPASHSSSLRIKHKVPTQHVTYFLLLTLLPCTPTTRLLCCPRLATPTPDPAAAWNAIQQLFFQQMSTRFHRIRISDHSQLP